MAGIIFVSEGMENPNTPEQRYAKAVIAYMVGAILAFSIFYYGIVFGSEVTGYTPKWLMKIFSEKKTHMHREFEKQSTHHPEHNRNPMHQDGDIEMVTKGKTSSMAEKLEKQRKYTEELKNKVYRKAGNGPGGPKSRNRKKKDEIFSHNPLRDGVKTQSRRVTKKRSFRPKKALSNQSGHKS
jgi:hypothetical protein